MIITTVDKVLVTVIVFVVSIVFGWLQALRKKGGDDEDFPLD